MPRGNGGQRPAPMPVQKLRKRQDKINHQAPEFADHNGSPPDNLSPEAVDEWWRVVPELKRLGLLTVVEVKQLAVYCEAVVTHDAAVADVRENGLRVPAAAGRGFVKNPACTIQKEMAGVIRSFAIEFGLTPAARNHVKADESSHGGDANFFN